MRTGQLLLPIQFKSSLMKMWLKLQYSIKLPDKAVLYICSLRLFSVVIIRVYYWICSIHSRVLWFSKTPGGLPHLNVWHMTGKKKWQYWHGWTGVVNSEKDIVSSQALQYKYYLSHYLRALELTSALKIKSIIVAWPQTCLQLIKWGKNTPWSGWHLK